MSRLPPHAPSGTDPPAADELEQLEELGDDAIIAQQQAAHAPKPRVQVTEEARSVVISDVPPKGSRPPPGAVGGARRERSEKTVVIRDRRQLDELRREIEKRRSKAPPPAPGVWVWVAVGVAAFLAGGLLALFATRGEGEGTLAPQPSVVAPAPAPSPPPETLAEPPAVSIDELPVEDGKKP